MKRWPSTEGSAKTVTNPVRETSIRYACLLPCPQGRSWQVTPVLSIRSSAIVAIARAPLLDRSRCDIAARSRGSGGPVSNGYGRKNSRLGAGAYCRVLRREHTRPPLRRRAHGSVYATPMLEISAENALHVDRRIAVDQARSRQPVSSGESRLRTVDRHRAAPAPASDDTGRGFGSSTWKHLPSIAG